MTVVSAVVLVALPAVVSTASSPPSAPGRLVVVQAVPGASYDVLVDGDVKQRDVEVGSVLGPFVLDPGKHDVAFAADGGEPVTASVEVRAGVDSDLVLHLPAQAGGEPVADVYRVPEGPLSPGMARVLIAHTATVPPADVRVDGQTVFEDVANGEFAVADLPAGPHTAEILPAGSTRDPILGPVKVDLAAGTVTMVYAVGTPTDGSMNVITHVESVPTTREPRPGRIPTGSAGLLRQAIVVDFGPS
ncbi:DUF4397 domain-containing protein [Nocardioides sp. YIM 152315]|uniref:DUF4397 domain-containing protein n=1 Tax=Nocardioides sp. YIM 152315 TaxID=3031760 RepID=UPI0023D9981E|nr:DUF4397 domain-containing protein [Nocardioides sp. YIM 152315]MDF1606006.1 DUF4397 domain-containing protein [Nocardioides sp. YIM 152315]